MPTRHKEIEETIGNAESKYRLAMMASRRARQINDGALVLIQTKALKPTSIALEEFALGEFKVEVNEKETRVSKARTEPAEEKEEEK